MKLKRTFLSTIIAVSITTPSLADTKSEVPYINPYSPDIYNETTCESLRIQIDEEEKRIEAIQNAVSSLEKYVNKLDHPIKLEIVNHAIDKGNEKIGINRVLLDAQTEEYNRRKCSDYLSQ